VIVEVDTASAVRVVGTAVISDVAPDAAPGVSVTVASSVMLPPFTEPVIVAVPATVPEVSVAV
jgi:hypothetical protein